MDGRGRPAAGYFTKCLAEDRLRDALDAARRGLLPGLARTGATFADAAAEWLRYVSEDREVSLRSGIKERARRLYGLPSNPVRDVETLRERYDATRFEFYPPREVRVLVRVAASDQDGAIFLTAAFTGLRRGRAVPMLPEVAEMLARLSHRVEFVGDDDLVFPGELGGYLEGSVLRRRSSPPAGGGSRGGRRSRDPAAGRWPGGGSTTAMRRDRASEPGRARAEDTASLSL